MKEMIKDLRIKLKRKLVIDNLKSLSRELVDREAFRESYISGFNMAVEYLPDLVLSTEEYKQLVLEAHGLATCEK